MNLDAFDLFAADVTADQVSQHGAPARACPCDGMPAYESESGTLLVMENLVCCAGAGPADRILPLLLPFSYKMVCIRAPSGLSALHDDVDAVWAWRPVIYDMKFTHTQRKGSQQELAYRIGIWQAASEKADFEDRLFAWLRECCANQTPHDEYEAGAQAILDGWPRLLPCEEANRRADAILREHLNPQQLLDLDASEGFYVRGTINRMYRVELSNGCQIVHPATRQVLASMCIHTDDWIPAADVALASKLMIDAGVETEAELLSGARVTPYAGRTKARRWERWCQDAERDLHPAPLEVAA